MQIIGFNFSKISAEKKESVSKHQLASNVEVTNVESEDVGLLKDQEALKLSFKYSIVYQTLEKEKKTRDLGSVNFEGYVIMSVSSEESKSLQDSWKKKKLSPEFQVPLSNFIMKKSTPKAVSLEDEVGLPYHVLFPQLKKSE